MQRCRQQLGSRVSLLDQLRSRMQRFAVSGYWHYYRSRAASLHCSRLVSLKHSHHGLVCTFAYFPSCGALHLYVSAVPAARL